MTSAQVTQVIENQVGGADTKANVYGFNLQRCLVTPPIFKTFKDGSREGQLIDLWLNFEEDPDTKAGYKIVFDEGTGRFGLAADDSRTSESIFLGYHGSFLETLKGM